NVRSNGFGGRVDRGLLRSRLRFDDRFVPVLLGCRLSYGPLRARVANDDESEERKSNGSFHGSLWMKVLPVHGGRAESVEP
ncbi:MAG TPA: hypothetical protein DDW52_12140, partial [Planctomycetaceae bacterium]|nr:hypothetical protein [Planctomycetaceae bacterium]